MSSHWSTQIILTSDWSTQEDDLGVTAVLHKHGALAFWDYATAAPYVNIDVNPKLPADTAGTNNIA